MNCTCTSTIAHWEESRQGDRQRLRYLRAGRELGTVLELAWGGLVVTVRDRTGKRHQRPARDLTQARQWVEDNAQ